MDYAKAWHCTYTYTGTTHLTGENCTVSATATSSLGVSTSSPLYVLSSPYDRGVEFGLAILIIIGGLIFMGLVFNSAGIRRR